MPVNRQEFDTRLENVRKKMAEDELKALVAYADNRITGNVRYLSNFSLKYSGYQSVSASKWIIYGGSVVVVPLEGNPKLITDCDFASSAVEELSVIKDAEFSFDLGLAVSRALGDLKGKIGVTTWDKFPHTLYSAIKDRLPEAILTPSFIVEDLRMIKSPGEIEIMKKAANVMDEATDAAVNALAEGKTEKEICLAAEYAMETRNPSPQFVPQTQVVTFGQRSAAWGYPSQAKLRKGDMVVIDLNNEYDGYVSDIARSKVFGSAPTKEQKNAYDVAEQMLRTAVQSIRPGVKAKAIWDAAAKVAKESGYERNFRPLISHGIGLDIQEKPSVGLDETILRPNMVITCEPALLMKDFGVAVEDAILITDTGRESLTKYEKRLEM
ncbi:MAG: M24 family metallopeptidase [Candidatus Bathyarchaeia archaeon]